MAATRCLTIYVNIEPDCRRQVERQIRSFDSLNGLVWSRSLSIQTGASGEQEDGSHLPLDCGTGSRPQINQSFIEQAVSNRKLQNRIAQMLSEQSRDEGGRGIFNAQKINIFVVFDLGSLASTAVVNEIAGEIRKAKEGPLAAMGLVDVSLMGVFLLYEPQSFDDHRKATVYACLKELHTLQRDAQGARGLFDSALFLSSQNVNQENPQGYNGLDETRFMEMVVEVLATLQSTPALVRKIVQRAPDYSVYASVGATSVFFNHEEIINQRARRMASAIIDKLIEPPQSVEIARLASEFWPDLQIEKIQTSRTLISGGQGKATAFQLIKFDPALWEYPAKSATDRLKIDYMDFLCQVPRRLALYTTYILTTRLREFHRVVEENSRRLQQQLSRQVEGKTDSLLRTVSPGAALAFLKSLRDRVEEERDKLKQEGTGEENLLRIEAGHDHLALERALEAGTHDLDYYYEELEQAIANRPLPLALFSRYAFLGVIAGFLLDLIVGRMPDFVLNVGPLKSYGVPVLLTLGLFILFGWLKHRRAARRYDLARRFYIAAVQAIAGERAGNFLRVELEKTYMAAGRKIEDEMLGVEKLQEQLQEMRGELEKPGEQEPSSHFHSPLVGGTLLNGMAVLEREPVFAYEMEGRREPDLKKEMHDFIQAEDATGRALANWRSLGGGDQESLDRFRSALLKFAERGYAHIRQKKLATLLKEHASAAHNGDLLIEMHRVGFSPMTVKQLGAATNVFIERYWVSSELQEYENGQVFPQINDTTDAIVSHYAGHFRTATLMNFPLSSVLFFRDCRQVYQSLSGDEKEALHIQVAAGMIDPIDDAEDGHFDHPTEKPNGPVV